jgi:hypothetical protein
MPKQSMRKSKSKSRGRKHTRKTKVQRGGVSNACVLDTATGTSVLQSNGLANLHNINPQASLDLDNKFMAYGGPVPLGSNILQGGANRCGDDGVGTSNSKPETFKQYLDGVSNKLDSAMTGGANEPTNEGYVSSNEAAMNGNNHQGDEGFGQGNASNVEEPIPNELNNIIIQQPSPLIQNISKENTTKFNRMTGGGFSTDPSEFIAGLPVYKAYDDCCPPAIVNGQLKFGAPDQAVCGFGAVKGGSRKRVNGMKKSKKQQRKTRGLKQRSHNGTQRGGDWTVATRSKPAMFDEAFNGPASVFAYPDDMSKRAFGETQPNYTPNAI